MKAHISFWSAFAIVGIIALMWTATLPSQFTQNAPIAETAKETVGPFSSFFGNVRTQLGAAFGAASSTESGKNTEQPTPSGATKDQGLVPVLNFNAATTTTPKAAPANVVLIGTSSAKSTME